MSLRCRVWGLGLGFLWFKVFGGLVVAFLGVGFGVGIFFGLNFFRV